MCEVLSTMVRGLCRVCKKVIRSGKLIIDVDGTPICTTCRPIQREEVQGYKPKKEKKKNEKTEET